MPPAYRFFVIAAAAFVSVSAAPGATQNGVVISGGQPIPGATVVAVCGTDRITTVTDNAGRFEIGGMPATPCTFSIAMFGFEPAEKEAAASATTLSFDLKLQTRATLAAEPGAPNAPAPRQQPSAPVRSAQASPPSPANPGTQSSTSNQTSGQNTQTATNRGPGRGGAGRGGYGRGGQGRGGQNAQNNSQNNAGGFQSLSLTQNGDAGPLVDSGDIGGANPGAGGDDTTGAGAADSFLVNGTVSNAIQPQQGDFAGLGAGPGGPNPFGPGGNPFAANTQANGLPSLGGGPGGGGPGGGFGGPAGGGRGGGGGGGGGRGGRGGGRGRGPGPNRNAQFGNRINRGRGRQFQGSAYYTVGNSVLNARPYAFTAPETLNGEEVPKAGYATNRFGFSAGGPLTIPHIFSSDKTFWFVNYTGNRSKTGFDDISTVPVLSSQLNLAAMTVTNPLTGQTYQLTNIDPTALKLLQTYYPAPNAPGFKNNFQLIGANPSNNDNLQTRINQTLTAKDGLDVNVNFQHRNSENIQNFGFADPTDGYGLSTNLTWRRTFNRSLINSVSWAFSRNLNHTQSYFQDLAAYSEANFGITGVDAAIYGPPTLNFADFTGLSDATPSSTRAQTSGESDQLIFIHGKQTMTFGAGVQRRQNNTFTEQNARGSLTFNGVETGYDLADFLEGLPQETSVTLYNDPSRYLRETTLNGFATDDFRWLSNLTINAGVRWEYFGPYSEKYNNISNLDYNPATNLVQAVQPGQLGYGSGLIDPDRRLFSPRVGIAWKPWKNRQIVTRAGYGVYYNGGVYGTLASRLLGQPPIDQSFTLQQVSASALSACYTTPLTLEVPFPRESCQTVTNTFGVDKNYHPGYAQAFTASVQETFKRIYVLELIYNGTKGTDLDVIQLPNRSAPGNPLTSQERLAIPYASVFQWDSSVGNSIYNALQVHLTRRMSHYASFNIFYTFSKAIDDSSTLGGGPVFIPDNIDAERALSPTDQRHNLRLNYQLQAPIANTRTGTFATLFRGWNLGGVLTITSGTPFTAVVAGDPSGTAYTGNDRAEATGLPVTNGTGFFNLAAFAAPASGTLGDAGRDTIPGIPRWSLNASLFRSFRIDDRRRIEFRIDTTNPLNHPYITSINTTVGSVQYGLPVAAGGMRNVTATVRLRF